MMVRMIADSRFGERPFYSESDLDHLCEKLLRKFFHESDSKIPLPIPTDDLTRLIERDTADFDPGADLSAYGADVEGVTEFFPGSKPHVRISATLADNERRENRYRTTLTHEYAHVHLHNHLFQMAAQTSRLIGGRKPAHVQVCKRDTMFAARKTDWMEWQAGYVCGALLMPVTLLRQQVAAFQEQHKLFGPIDASSDHAGKLIVVVADAFQVSSEAARVRLSVLGLLGKGAQARSLFG
jgi:hypothetical protein